ncbi:unnamed protein product [Dovyalis caffra]|uniref:Uncharacterized protein n=1 Tax=Dovyalis caffra TaxID=77055 RepID=A0AAV1QUV6_9ROSI|nr:unnamed protein product [Dovyalis caffra]
MDINNGTQKKKGNATIPPGRGQIKAQIYEDLKTFVTGGLGKKSENDGDKSVTSLPANGSCSHNPTSLKNQRSKLEFEPDQSSMARR